MKKKHRLYYCKMKFVISSKVCATKTSIYHLRNKTKITQISLDIKIT